MVKGCFSESFTQKVNISEQFNHAESSVARWVTKFFRGLWLHQRFHEFSPNLGTFPKQSTNYHDSWPHGRTLGTPWKYRGTVGREQICQIWRPRQWNCATHWVPSGPRFFTWWTDGLIDHWWTIDGPKIGPSSIAGFLRMRWLTVWNGSRFVGGKWWTSEFQGPFSTWDD